MNNQDSKIQNLLSAAQQGDEAARNDLFDRCRNYVNIIARTQMETWMRTKVDASDLVQQTLMEAHQGFEQFRGNNEGEWLAWLKQILSRNTTDFMRHYRTAKRAVGKEVNLTQNQDNQTQAWDLTDALPTASQLLMQHESQLQLADAIAKLSPDYQEVIHLRNLQQLSFNEVAERMGRTRPATQMLWMRALQKLEDMLADSEEDPDQS